MADHFDALFEIGDLYRYRLTCKNVNGAPIYQSSRSTDRNDNNNCVWLHTSQDGHWIATKAPKTCDDPVNEGQPKFRTFTQVQNIEDEQWIEWQRFDTPKLRRKGKRRTMTHALITEPMTIELDVDSGSFPGLTNLEGPEALVAMLAILAGAVPHEPTEAERARQRVRRLWHPPATAWCGALQCYYA
jgi:hypothetical protein